MNEIKMHIKIKKSKMVAGEINVNKFKLFRTKYKNYKNFLQSVNTNKNLAFYFISFFTLYQHTLRLVCVCVCVKLCHVVRVDSFIIRYKVDFMCVWLQSYLCTRLCQSSQVSFYLYKSSFHIAIFCLKVSNSECWYRCHDVQCPCSSLD